MSKKLNAKQTVEGGVDLDAWVKSGASIPTKPAADTKTEDAVKPAKRGKVGRPKVQNKRQMSLQVKLSESEFAKLKEAAGLVPMSSYVRQKMLDKDII